MPAEVKEYEAGRELDTLIAEKVMGLQNVSLRQHVQGEDLFGEHDGLTEWVPSYSTDIAAAMGALQRWQGDFDIRRQNGSWRVTLFEPSMQYEEWADTAPLAICRAALAASAR